MAFDKAMALYDWTAASFIRQDLFNQLQYTAVDGCPLDLRTMARVIWGCSYPGYTHADSNFMNMFMLAPPTSEAALYESLSSIADTEATRHRRDADLCPRDPRAPLAHGGGLP